MLFRSPKHEKHLIEWMEKVGRVIDGKPVYQYHKLEKAMKEVSKFKTRTCGMFGRAIDVGAHCGLWSMHLCKWFDVVWAFEPVDLHRRCFGFNCAGHKNFVLFCDALGGEDNRATMITGPNSSGDTRVLPYGGVPAGYKVAEDWVLVRVFDEHYGDDTYGSMHIPPPIDFEIGRAHV